MTVWPTEVQAGGGVVLRAPDPIDAAEIADAVNSSLDHLGRFLDWAAEPTSVDVQAVRLAIAAEAFGAGADATYSIFYDDEVAGSIGLHRRLGPGAVEIGYWLRADREGRGIVTTSVRSLLGVAFDVDGTERVVIHCHPSNTRSAAVARRLGFSLLAEEPRMEWELRRPGGPTRGR